MSAKHPTARKAPEAPQSLPMGRGHGPGGRGRPVKKAKDARGALKRLWQYLKHQKNTLILVTFLVILSTLLNLTGPFLMGYAIDHYIANHQITQLAQICLIMIMIYALASLTTWLQNFFMIGASQRTIRNLRQALFDKMQTLSIRFFDQHTHGELMSRLTNDIDNISNTLTSSITQLISSLLSIIGVSTIMLLLNWRLALISLLTVPVVLFGIQPIIKRTRKGYIKQQQKLGVLNGLIEETVSGQKVIKAYCREEKVLQEFKQANEALTTASIRARILAGVMGPLMNVINNISFAVVVFAGSWLTLNHLATVGLIASFTNYARQFNRPLNQIATLFSSIQSALAGAERVFEVIDETPDVQDRIDATEPKKFNGYVSFDDVTFSYQQNVPILKHITFTANPGQMIALVGPTGAGKTTIINLLTRFYDIDSGQIKIDNHDIRSIKKDQLRRKLGIVLQDTYLFGHTIRECIRYGKLDATDDQIYQAAHLANADTFIHRLPHGYETVLSAEGSNLSQGQRQLLAIARATLADPEILILDEATSSVDTRTEVSIQEALLKLMKGRTSFVIAHRLSTIQKADQILVINDGEIIERGNHHQLLNQHGFYYNLYMSQFKQKLPTSASD